MAFAQLEERQDLRKKHEREFEMVTSELSLELGRTVEAVQLAESLLNRPDLTPDLVVRAHVVRATTAFYRGDVKGSLETLARAVRASEQCDLRTP